MAKRERAGELVLFAMECQLGTFPSRKTTVRFKLSCAQTPCVLHPLDAGYAKSSRWLARFPDRSHVSIKHIAGIEKGQKDPSFEILQALAEALDLSLDNLIEKISVPKNRT